MIDMTEEMKRMQREAEERVRQMHAKAQQYATPPLTIREEKESCEKSSDSLMPVEDKGMSQDRMLILLIVVLLMKNDAKMELILALLYLLV